MSQSTVYSLWSIQIFLVVFVWLTPDPVFAQASVRQHPQQRVINEDQQRLDELRRQRRNQQSDKAWRPRPDIVPALVDEKSQGLCFTISSINFDGASAFSPKELADSVSEFLGACLDAERLALLLDKVSGLYLDRGFITSRAYLKEQDLADGVLEVQIIEGVVEAIVDSSVEPSVEPSGEPAADRAAEFIIPPSSLDTKSQSDDWQGANFLSSSDSGAGSPTFYKRIFPVDFEKPLNLRDLEQGLENINRLRSFNASMKLIPGQSPGASVVEITEQRSRNWFGQLSLNNGGQEATGRDQAQLMLSLENITGHYDSGFINWQSDTEWSRREFLSESLAIHWEMPWGYWLFNLDASSFRYRRRVSGVNQQFETSGNSDSQALGLDYRFFRNENQKAGVSLAVTRKKTSNFIEDVRLENSSRALTIATLKANWERRSLSHGKQNFELEYARGLSALASLDDDHIPGGARHQTPKAQFDRYRFAYDYHQPFELFGRNIRSQGRWAFQYSPDLLFGSEQQSIGSQYTVRGYREEGYSGNSGAYFRNDLVWDWRAAAGLPLIHRAIPSVGLDFGLVRNPTDGSTKYQKLYGLTFGLKLLGKRWSLDGRYSVPVAKPEDFDDSSGEFYLSAQVSF